MIIRKAHIFVASMISVSITSVAQTNSSATATDSFGGSLTARITQTDNARKTEDALISERQDELGGSLFANYENSLLQFDADYNLNGTNYTEDSQDNQNFIEGQAALQIGKEKDLFDLLLSQSQRTQYGSPDDVALNENLDDRTVWTATPSLKMQLSEVDTLAVQGTYSLVEYRTNSTRDSTRAGGVVYWRHRLSAISSFNLSVGADQIEYPNGDLDDYDSLNARLSYTAQTRYLNYTVLAGVNNATFADGGKDYTAPMFKIDVTYENGGQAFEFNASQDITDSSIGDGNQDGVDPTPGNDGVGVDQMERKQFGLRWRTQSICSRCSFDLYAQYRDDEYRRLKQENNDESSAGLMLRYRLTERAGVEFGYRRQWQQYAQIDRPSFTRDYLSLMYLYDFTQRFNGSLFYQFEAAEGEVGSNEYEQNNYGFALTYSF
ncbi:hypothetical protein QWY82_06705 [Simiduia curdlanivorans]|uniref:TIGR03016 family PEP-CTERM system-associated outer membrane protein n=1 Tax=Simiduia curdlanivorans TaxID=1492769 RepID=A0ABV8VB53_9GAMM|nr:hypothetical protein [Simiduia curdlanivorans]MDN3638494.1 hypothetical protein [Simiduia curdlanivorans]